MSDELTAARRPRTLPRLRRRRPGVGPRPRPAAAVERDGASRPTSPSPTFPLHLRVCPTCGLGQIGEYVLPERIFGAEYPYLSSVSTSWLAHAGAYAAPHDRRARARPTGDLVMEVASNDGYLLDPDARRGMRVLGIEPAGKVAEIARDARRADGQRVLRRSTLAEQVVAEHGHPRLVAANNVMAHVPDLRRLRRPASRHLCDDRHGRHRREPVLRHPAARRRSSTRSTTSTSPTSPRTPSRGPPRRHRPRAGPGRAADHPRRLQPLLADPHRRAARRTRASAADDRRGARGRPARRRALGRLRRRAAARRSTGLRTWLDERHAAGRTVAGYGAAAKGNTLMNAAGVRRRRPGARRRRQRGQAGQVPARQPRPGGGARRRSPARGADDVLILPWNIAPEIGRLVARARPGRDVLDRRARDAGARVIERALGLRGVALLRGAASPRRARLPPQGRSSPSEARAPRPRPRRRRGGRPPPTTAAGTIRGHALPGGPARRDQDAVGHRRRAVRRPGRPAAGRADVRPAGSRSSCRRRTTSPCTCRPGVAHGYQTLEDDTRLTYLISAGHSPEHARTLRVGRPDRRRSTWPLPADADLGEGPGGARRGRPRPDHRRLGPDRHAGSLRHWDDAGIDARRRSGTPTSTCWPPARPPTSSPARRRTRVVHLAWSASGTRRLPHLRRQRPLGRRHPGARRGRHAPPAARVWLTGHGRRRRRPTPPTPTPGRRRDCGRALAPRIEDAARRAGCGPTTSSTRSARRPALVDHAASARERGETARTCAAPHQRHDFVHASDVGRAIVTRGGPRPRRRGARSARAGCARSPTSSPRSAPRGRPTRRPAHPPPTHTGDDRRHQPPDRARLGAHAEPRSSSTHG